MMEAFPAPAELIGFFGSAPVLRAPGQPWIYNAVRFETTRGADHVVCELWPSYEELQFSWSREGDELVRLALQDVWRLTVEQCGGRQALIAELRGERRVPLRIELAPRVRVTWISSEG